MSAEEAESVLAVNLAYNGGDLVEDGLCCCIENSLANAFHVRGDAVHAVGVDAAQVGLDEAVCYDGCIGFWDAIAGQDVGDEAAGRWRGLRGLLALEEQPLRRLPW